MTRHPLSCTFTLTLTLTLTLALAAASTTRVGIGATPARNASSFNAWVFCVDTSLSPLADQFAKMKRILEHAVDTMIDSNDRVWLLEIDDQSQPATLFNMPLVSNIRSGREAADGRLIEAKSRIKRAIEDLQQRASTTEVRDPEARSLNLLRAQSGATIKSLVMVSDFVTDAGPGRVSALPPTSVPGVSANGIRVALLVAQPRPNYLHQLRLSPSELFFVVDTKWRNHFLALGAAHASVQLLDAWPER